MSTGQQKKSTGSAASFTSSMTFRDKHHHQYIITATDRDVPDDETRHLYKSRCMWRALRNAVFENMKYRSIMDVWHTCAEKRRLNI